MARTDQTSPKASAQTAGKMKVDWHRAFGLREIRVFYALVLRGFTLAFLTAYLGNANYLSVQNIINVLYQTSFTATMAAAMTVILVTGNFDLSVTYVAALSAAVMFGTVESLGILPAFGVAMGVAILCGLLNGSITMFLGINAFIVTLGTLTAIRVLVLIYTDGCSFQVSDPETVARLTAIEGYIFDIGMPMLIGGLAMLVLAAISFGKHKQILPSEVGLVVRGGALAGLSLSNDTTFPLRMPVVITPEFVGYVWSVLAFTTVGCRVYAVGRNPEAARLSGVNLVAY